MRFRHIISAVALACAGAPVAAHDGVHIYAAYARFLPGGQTGVAYMQIENHAIVDDRLIGARSPVAGMTEPHVSMESADGMMAMTPAADGIPVPASETVTLAPGGSHIMFMHLSAAPEDGATVPLTLIFEHAGEVTVDVPVDNRRKADAPAASDHVPMEHPSK